MKPCCKNTEEKGYILRDQIPCTPTSFLQQWPNQDYGRFLKIEVSFYLPSKSVLITQSASSKVTLT